MTLRAFYRRAAITERLHDRANARLEALSRILVRRVDTVADYTMWRSPSKRIVRVLCRRKATAFEARSEARDRMLYDPREDKALERTLENVRRYARTRKREMS